VAGGGPPVTRAKGKAYAGPRIDPMRKLVVCVDGPKAGQWWYLDEWKDLRARAQDMEAYLEVRPTVLDYEPLTALRAHPTAPGTSGNALRYRPGWDAERAKAGV
jgi:hypothetical protein